MVWGLGEEVRGQMSQGVMYAYSIQALISIPQGPSKKDSKVSGREGTNG
jgi:hypothetical protein